MIERVRWRDLPALARVQRASFRPGLAYGLTALAFLRAMPGVVFLVARLPGLPVAGCVIGDQYKGDLRVVNIAVAPAARRRGVATALLRAIEAAQPAGNVVLIAEVHNTGAQALYEREGYVRSSHARDYYGRGRHGIWMRKDRTGEPPRTIRV